MTLPGLLLASAVAGAQAPPPPIVNGETTSDWPAVGMLAAYDESSGEVSVFCSATLVADQAVVTAAHCAEAALTYDNWGLDAIFVVGSDITEPVDYVPVGDWVEHPDYYFDGTGVAADVAVGLLADPLAVDVDPMPMHTDDLGTAWYDQDLTLVGFGITGDNRVDAGTKRTTTLPVLTLDGDFVYAVDSDPDGSNACSGDSGGAALRQGQDGWELVGVLSFVFSYYDAGTSCIGGGVGATRVDVYGDWVQGEAGSDGDGGSVEGDPPGGTGSGGDNPFLEGEEGGCSSLPGAASLGPLGLAMAALGRRRRRGR